MEFELNGEACSVPITNGETALDVIRGRLRLTGAKSVCGQGVCGACTILIDGKPTVSCLYPADRLLNKKVETVEAFNRSNLHPIQKAFMALDGLQCGYCTPGFIVESIAFFKHWRSQHGISRPPKAKIAEALAGHLCRCGAYPGIYEAVATACAGDFDQDEVVHAARVDALEKVTGDAQYTADLHIEQQLYGVFVRSPHAHARIVSIDMDAALEFPGVISIINLLEGEDTVRYVGQEILALAVTDKYTGEQALKFIGIEYELLPAQTSLNGALENPDILVYPDKKSRKNVPNAGEGRASQGKWKGNEQFPKMDLFSKRRRAANRRVKTAIKKQDPLLVNDTWTTAFQVHTALEPHTCLAKWEKKDEVTVFLSTQACDSMSREIASHFDLKPEQVQVICKYVGGGFGAKTGMTMEAIAAVRLSRASGSAVKVTLTRMEEMEVGGCRPATKIELGLLANKEGKMKALKAKVHTNSGVAVSAFSAGLMRLIYPNAPKSLLDIDVVNNLPPGKPFRAPSAPQTCWALEQAVDAIAHQLNQDPISLRLQWDQHKLRQQLLKTAQETELWNSRKETGSQVGRFRTGVGVASGNWFNFYHPKTQIRITLSAKGISAICATQDIGSGTTTVIAKVIGEVFEVDPQSVIVYIGTSKAVKGPMAAGSRSVNSLYTPTLEAAKSVKADFMKAIKEQLGIAQFKIMGNGIAYGDEVMDWRAIFRKIPPIMKTMTRGTDQSFDWLAKIPVGADDAAFGRGFSAAVYISAVTVDTWLGKVTVDRVWGGIAAGKIIVPTLAKNQCHGGVIQGIGYALYEERLHDPETGRIVTVGLEDYRIPVIGDTPEIELFFLESGFEKVKGQAVGIGEISTIPVAASIGNAVFNATGWQPRSLPIRPDKIVEQVQ